MKVAWRELHDPQERSLWELLVKRLSTEKELLGQCCRWELLERTGSEWGK